MSGSKNPARRKATPILRVEALGDRLVPAGLLPPPEMAETALASTLVIAPTDPIAGDATGTFTASNPTTDAGRIHTFQGTVDLEEYGQAQVAGTIQGVGFARYGNAKGILTLTKGQSVLKIEVFGSEQPAFSALPPIFKYRVLSATGEFGGTFGRGTMNLSLGANNGFQATFGPSETKGTANGSYTEDASGVPYDAGIKYDLEGLAQVDGIGSMTVQAHLETLGFVFTGNAHGSMTLTSPKGSITLSLTGPTQQGGAPLPGRFTYFVSSSTGNLHLPAGELELTLQSNGTWSAVFGGSDSTDFPNNQVPDARYRNEIDSVYRTYLHREADEAGRAAWIAARKAGISLTDISNAILASAEFAVRNKGNEAFIRSLYTDVLGRAGSEREVAAWVAAANAGLKRETMARLFLDSNEGIGRSVDSFYRNYLGRDADAGGRSHWIAKIQSGALTQEQTIAAFLESAEYKGKLSVEIAVG